MRNARLRNDVLDAGDRVAAAIVDRQVVDLVRLPQPVAVAELGQVADVRRRCPIRREISWHFSRICM
jgi:hypothetical protein